MASLLLPILILLIPVMTIVVLAIRFDRKLSGSCGGVGSDGRCTKCGKPAAEMPADGRPRTNSDSPANFSIGTRRS